MWKPKSHRTVIWASVWIYQVLLFSLPLGQSSNTEPLPSKRMASERSIYSRPCCYLALVNPKHVLLPPLPIKLGLMNNFVKTLDKEGDAFQYLTHIFATLSDAKVKEGMFVGSQIRKILRDEKFDHSKFC